MLHIVTEDSASGKMFWSKIVKALNLDKDERMKISSSVGDGNYYETVKDIGLTERDTLLLALDKVGTNEHIKIMSQVEGYQEEIGFGIVYPAYYCIEEIPLSFKYMAVWGKCTDEGVISLASDVGEYLRRNNIKTWDIDEAWVREAIAKATILGYNPYNYKSSSRKTVLLNRENLIKYLLSDLTKESKAKFRWTIHSSDLGKCWFESCSKVRKQFKNRSEYCHDCGVTDKEMTALGQLRFFVENSMSAHREVSLLELKTLIEKD